MTATPPRLGQGIGVVLSSVHALYLTLQIALRHSSVLEEEEEEEVKDLGLKSAWSEKADEKGRCRRTL